jgi:FkbM family methyltransferase
VFAFEPMPETFELLAANAFHFPYRNVTLFNLAASDSSRVVGMAIPSLDTGLDNFYRAHVASGTGGDRLVYACALDVFPLERPIALIKVDAEGHELPALLGMRKRLETDTPTLIVEANSQEVVSFLEPLGYAVERLPESPNFLCRSRSRRATSSRS